MRLKPIFVLILLISLAFVPAPAGADEANDLVQAAFDYYRGKASYAVVDMTVHRPDWERTMTIKGWTKGTADSLFLITAPAKDNGNGTLKKGREMWMFNPKVNRVIKLPPSMMSQAWMGSDFSNNDLAKSDTLIEDYVHTLEGTETQDGKKVYLIKSMPKPQAPVIWGMIKLKVREDYIFLSQEFFDEDLKSVKIMTSEKIQMMGGRLFPKIWRMKETDAKDKYTLLNYHELQFLDSLDDGIFTLSNLKKPKQ